MKVFIYLFLLSFVEKKPEHKQTIKLYCLREKLFMLQIGFSVIFIIMILIVTSNNDNLLS